jgi:hypothetical protein
VRLEPSLDRAVPQFRGVDEISVVREGDATAGGGGAEDGLGIFPDRRTGRRVPAVADGDMPLQRLQDLLVEYLADQPEIFEDDDVFAVGDGDSGGFLPAVLKRVEPVVGELRDLLAGSPHTEDTAFFAGFRIGLVDCVCRGLSSM